MGKQYSEISEQLKDFIQKQKIFFVGSAACDGRVNISPKGMDTLRVMGANRVIWVNLTGSGNGIAAHLLENDRITLMFCAFEGNPMILRIYGHARVFHPRDPEWGEFIPLFPSIPGARQIIDINVDLVQTSCGMAVPYFSFLCERDQLKQWAENKGPEGIEQYWRDRNQVSLDGKPTGIFGKDIT